MVNTVNEIAKATETARVLLEAGADEARVLAAFYARVDALMRDNSAVSGEEGSNE
jgi:hypothetical protein